MPRRPPRVAARTAGDGQAAPAPPGLAPRARVEAGSEPGAARDGQLIIGFVGWVKPGFAGADPPLGVTVGLRGEAPLDPPYEIGTRRREMSAVTPQVGKELRDR